MSLINKIMPLFKLYVGMNQYKRKWTSYFLGWKLIIIWFGKRILSLCYPNWSVCYVVRCLKHYSTIRTLKMVHYAYFHSAIMYGIIFWGNSIDSNKVFFGKRELRGQYWELSPEVHASHILKLWEYWQCLHGMYYP